MSRFKSVKIGENNFVLKYQDLLPPLSLEQRSELKADIEKRGIITPIIATGRDLVVIDGANRVEIAAELGLKYVAWNCVHPATEDEEREMAIVANLHRRHMTREQRAEWVAKLRSEGWSTPKIAEAVGVSAETVRTDIKKCATSQNLEVAQGVEDVDTPAKILGQDGKQRPAERPTVDELAERRARATELKEAGKTRKEIASDLGVSVRTVANDLSEVRVAEKPTPEPQAHPDNWEQSWTRKYRSYIIDIGAKLALHRIAAMSDEPADQHRKIRWELYPDERSLLDSAESLQKIVEHFESDLQAIKSEVRRRRASVRSHLRVVGLTAPAADSQSEEMS